MSSYPHISPKLRRLSHQNHNSKPSSSFNSSPPCDHSPLATFDLLILVLVLFSCTFLIGSTLTYIFRCLSLMLPSTLYAISAASLRDDPIPYLTGFLVFLAASAATVEISCYRSCLWSRRCGNRRCRGLRNAVEFDVQLQTEECIRLISSSDASASAASAAWKEIDELPWKGGKQGDSPEYECLRAELRRMAPPNGRAVLLFRARCGCPIAKLEAWGSKRGRRHKNLTMLRS
ncbi:hypothetical protein HPP92_006528 [Vanilla planifolia]|uniref:Ribosomal protein L34e superfamily protein n=1 Tax=Vanilla planifolia TaxID=51239 RepID=A0A835RCC1_VANPL|nr:hypothetical protein HPP92_006528 [Vanilla planifolia]